MPSWVAIVLVLALTRAAPTPRTGPSGIQEVHLDDWLRQCVPQFKATGFRGPTSTHYSNYYLIQVLYAQQHYSNYYPHNSWVPEQEPSGLCADALSCAFERCAWTNDTAQALMTHDLQHVTFQQLRASFPPVNLPDRIAIPNGVHDLVKAVQFAAENGFKVSVKTSGHR